MSDAVRSSDDSVRENAHDESADAPKPAKSTPEERLSRIAEAHSKNVTVEGMTSGLCDECYQNYPCPTYVWASSDQRDVLATWDPIDDDTEGWA